VGIFGFVGDYELCNFADHIQYMYAQTDTLHAKGTGKTKKHCVCCVWIL